MNAGPLHSLYLWPDRSHEEAQMGESTKAACSLLIIVGIIAACLAWGLVDRPGVTAWGFRVGGPIVAILALGLLLKLHFRADLAHDYLHDLVGKYFNRDGFCFSFMVTPIDGIAYMDAYFQSQYDEPCVGRIVLKPAYDLLKRWTIEAIAYQIECGPAAFGFARIAIPVPSRLQGKQQPFKVGVSVKYPNGKGQRLRFHDGVFIRTDSNFKNWYGTALTGVGAATGSFVLTTPALARVKLPVGVAEAIPSDRVPEVKTLWRIGDPSPQTGVPPGEQR